MASIDDVGSKCKICTSKCPGFAIHRWRATCTACKCSYKDHDVSDFSRAPLLTEMNLGDSVLAEKYNEAASLAKRFGYITLPCGLSSDDVNEYINCLQSNEVPKGTAFEKDRMAKLRRQIPPQDRKPASNIPDTNKDHFTDDNTIALEGEMREASRFQSTRNKRDIGIGILTRVSGEKPCFNCGGNIHNNTLGIKINPEHKSHHSSGGVSAVPHWHVGCFKCQTCEEKLVDNIYGWVNGRPYCVRHYGQYIRPRCATCDHLIFSEEYTRAMDHEHHTGHFACKSCDNSLTGQRYILRDEEPHCLNCYELKFANTCEQCHKKIGCDAKDLSFKERHWHEKCFKCSACETSLADRPFATKDDDLFCSECYDERFAARCDGCQKVFKAGMRKYEYRGQQWHEECFICAECKKPIGAKSFIPRENQVICVPCYETKYAQRCTKCSEVIRRGGVTYKGNPWHKECFNCTSCGKQLAGLKFTSKEDQPYCADCYGDLFAKKCTKCTKPITGFGGCKFISFEDRHWHSDCFACSKCDANLVGRGFLTSDDLIMCSDCGR